MSEATVFILIIVAICVIAIIKGSSKPASGRSTTTFTPTTGPATGTPSAGTTAYKKPATSTATATASPSSTYAMATKKAGTSTTAKTTPPSRQMTIHQYNGIRSQCCCPVCDGENDANATVCWICGSAIKKGVS